MDSRDRFVCALELEEPDTVPALELVIPVDIARVVLGKEPLIYDNTEFLLELQRKKRLSRSKAEWINRQRAKNYHELSSKLDLDVIHFSESRFVPAGSVEKINEHEWVVDDSRIRFGRGTYWNEKLHKEKIEDSEKDPMVALNRIEENEKRSLENAKNAQFPNLKRLTKLNKEKFILFNAGHIWYLPTDFPAGSAHFTWYYRHPDVVKKMNRLRADSLIEYAKAAIDHGADGIISCNDFGYRTSTWISPRHFRRFIYPNLKRAADAIGKKHSFFIVHSDGNNEPILDMFAEAGIDAYQSIDIQAGMDLAEVKRRIGDKVCLIGNVALQVLYEGSEVEVRREVERCIRSAAGGGGYVLSSSGGLSLFGESPLENLRAMIRHVREMGKYAF